MTVLKTALWSLTPSGGSAVPLYVSRYRLGVRAEIAEFEAWEGDVDSDELSWGSAATRELSLLALLEGQSNLTALDAAVRAGKICALSGDVGGEGDWLIQSVSDSRKNALNLTTPLYSVQIGLLKA